MRLPLHHGATNGGTAEHPSAGRHPPLRTLLPKSESSQAYRSNDQYSGSGRKEDALKVNLNPTKPNNCAWDK